MSNKPPNSDYVHIPVLYKEFEHKGEIKFIDKAGKAYWIPSDVIYDLTYANGLYVKKTWAVDEGLIEDED